MKICPNCGCSYDNDSMKFCTKCGNPLVDKNEELPVVYEEKASGAAVPPPIPPVGVPASGMPPARKKGGKVLKTILLSVVGLIIVGFLVYQHMLNKATYMRLNPDQIIFTKQGSEVDVAIDYDGYFWEVNYAPDWCDIYRDDDSFSIHCTTNRTGQDREDYVTISSGKLVAQVYVGQYGHATHIDLSESSLSVDKAGGSIDVTIDSDGSDFEITHPDYCTVTNATNEGFTLSFAENNDSGRSGTVVVKDGEEAASIYFYQKGICSVCKGTGKTQCWACNGTGSVWNWYTSTYSTCTSCGGTGSVDCSYCNGTGNE